MRRLYLWQELALCWLRLRLLELNGIRMVSTGSEVSSRSKNTASLTRGK